MKAPSARDIHRICLLKLILFILSRYDHFISQKMITHITTNLDSQDIEEVYGLRVRSRLREMCNVVCFGSQILLQNML